MPDRFDALVIGGGVIGASIAWRLARENVRVLLLDAGKIGAEASSAAAGMLAPGGEFGRPSPLLDLAIASLGQYDEFVDQVQSDSGLKIDFERKPSLQLALDAGELESLTNRASFHRSVGIPCTVLDRAEINSLAPSAASRAIGAVHYLNEAIIDPATLMIALRAACLARGVAIQENSRVVSLASDSDGVRGCLADQSVNARCAVLAAGAWSGAINVTLDNHPLALPRSFPVKGHLLGYRLAPGSLPITIRHGHTYILQRADGFTIAGSSTENAGFDRTIDQEIVSQIAARAAALVPALASHEPESVWIGFRPGADSAPHLGRAGTSRLWLAYGHYRNGILLAPATSAQVFSELQAALRALE
jgi:glycine oxidase